MDDVSVAKLQGYIGVSPIVSSCTWMYVGHALWPIFSIKSKEKSTSSKYSKVIPEACKEL